MEKPANIDGELLGFGTGQEHAVVERVKKARLTDPAPPFHQLRLHDRDLPRWPAERNESKLEPEAERFAEARFRGRRSNGHAAVSISIYSGQHVLHSRIGAAIGKGFLTANGRELRAQWLP